MSPGYLVPVEKLSYSSFRRMPESSYLIVIMDSGFRQNDDSEVKSSYISSFSTGTIQKAAQICAA